jgi:protein-tyrosine-phosphatase
MKRILFLCPDNSALSPMAQALARLYAQEDTRTYSAGLAAADAFEHRLAGMLGELGLSPRISVPQSLAEHDDLSFDSCVLLGPADFHAPGVNIDLHWVMAEPCNLADDAYRALRDRLAERVRHLMNLFETEVD